MIERDLQDYLSANPDILFPGQKVQEKAREYQIQGKRIDILFVVDGTRYIVELKKVPIKREHIGQIVEYYGLMKSYLHEANLKMILVSPCIPEFRRAYLEELGIRCVELAGVPEGGERVAEVKKQIASRHRAEHREADLSTNVPPDVRLVFDEFARQATPSATAIVHRVVRDSLEVIRRGYPDYEIMPFKITRGHSPNIMCMFPEGDQNGPMNCGSGGVWWAFGFGHAEEMPKNDVPNISVNASLVEGLHVTVNAELKPSQQVMLRRIQEDKPTFDRLVSEHGNLRFRSWLKLEHQPRFYHWIPLDVLEPGTWDSTTLLARVREKKNDFRQLRSHWIARVRESHRALSTEQAAHMDKANRTLNLATSLVRLFPKEDPLWQMGYPEQIACLNHEIIRLKPLVEFFLS